MRIDSFELRHLELELVEAVETSAVTHRRRPVVLVTVFTDEGQGVGECSALVEPVYRGELLDDAEAVLESVLLPMLLQQRCDVVRTEDALLVMSSVEGKRMAKAAVEMTLLDAELRAERRSLADRLGARRSMIDAGATIGVASIEQSCHRVADLVDLGYRRVKVKISPRSDRAVLPALRSEHPDLSLAADANGSFRADDDEHTDFLCSLDAVGLSMLEQPFAPSDLVGHARLRARVTTPVILDESIVSIESLDDAVRLGALDGMSLKPARVGGVLAALALHDRCVDAGVRLCIGGMFESGVGRAAALAVGALEGFDLPGDLGASDQYFAEDLTGAHELVAGGFLTVPSGPGLGIELNAARVDGATTRTVRIEP